MDSAYVKTQPEEKQFKKLCSDAFLTLAATSPVYQQTFYCQFNIFTKEQFLFIRAYPNTMLFCHKVKCQISCNYYYNYCTIGTQSSTSMNNCNPHLSFLKCTVNATPWQPEQVLLLFTTFNGTPIQELKLDKPHLCLLSLILKWLLFYRLRIKEFFFRIIQRPSFRSLPHQFAVLEL